MADGYPIAEDLDQALSQIMDYCVQHGIRGNVALAMFETGVGAYHNIQRRGITLSVEDAVEVPQ